LRRSLAELGAMQVAEFNLMLAWLAERRSPDS